MKKCFKLFFYFFSELSADLYYGGEAFSVEQPQSFTCPYCGKMGYTETSLQEHVTSEHAETSTEVVSTHALFVEKLRSVCLMLLSLWLLDIQSKMKLLQTIQSKYVSLSLDNKFI